MSTRDTSKYTIVNLPRADRDVMLPTRDRFGKLIQPTREHTNYSNAEVIAVCDYYYEGGTQLSPELRHFNW